jgi:hypothetical protein
MSLSQLTKRPPIASIQPFLKSQTQLPQGIAFLAFIISFISGISSGTGKPPQVAENKCKRKGEDVCLL